MLSIPQRIAHVAADVSRLTSRSNNSGHVALSLILVNLPQCSAKMQILRGVVETVGCVNASLANTFEFPASGASPKQV